MMLCILDTCVNIAAHLYVFISKKLYRSVQIFFFLGSFLFKRAELPLHFGRKLSWLSEIVQNMYLLTITHVVEL